MVMKKEAPDRFPPVKGAEAKNNDAEMLVTVLRASAFYKRYVRAFKVLTGAQISLIQTDDRARPSKPGQTIAIPVRCGKSELRLIASGLTRSIPGSRIPSRKRRAALTLFELFADSLGEMSQKLVLNGQKHEPRLVARAKEYVASHKTSEISLAHVSDHLNVSKSYLCKLFRKVTRLKFSDYVSRVRVEYAKELLLGSDQRISEVAFDAGFQSLTHFNRTFARLAGFSPSQFRRSQFVKEQAIKSA